VLAIDHRSQFEDLIAETGGDAARIPHFKTLALRAVAVVAGGERPLRHAAGRSLRL
jgi:5-dehydro-2-deoxygluconokinase